MLAVIETHPVQYHAPVYRALQGQFGVPVTAIYGSDFSVAGYHDKEFGASFSWDTDLLSGYNSVFLSRVADGGAGSFAEVSTRGLRESLERCDPKAVMVTGYSPRFNRVALYEALRTRLPVLFRAETTDHSEKRGIIKAAIRDCALRLSYRKAARLLYIGQHSFRHYNRLGCAGNKLFFSPYCVDITPFRFDEAGRAELRGTTRRSLDIEEDCVVLLFSGKLYWHKRPDLLLHAVKSLPTEVRRKSVVVFLGSGEMADELRRLAVAEPCVRVIFPGFQNQTKLSAFYHAADVLVLPSRGETWGLVVNEALHHGLPCLVSDAVGCAPDLIEDGVTGLVFAADSAEGLAAALQRVRPLVRRAEVRANCRRKVDGYTVAHAAQGLALAYREVVGDAAAEAGMRR